MRESHPFDIFNIAYYDAVLKSFFFFYIVIKYKPRLNRIFICTLSNSRLPTENSAVIKRVIMKVQLLRLAYTTEPIIL